MVNRIIFDGDIKFNVRCHYYIKYEICTQVVKNMIISNSKGRIELGITRMYMLKLEIF